MESEGCSPFQVKYNEIIDTSKEKRNKSRVYFSSVQVQTSELTPQAQEYMYTKRLKQHDKTGK